MEAPWCAWCRLLSGSVSLASMADSGTRPEEDQGKPHFINVTSSQSVQYKQQREGARETAPTVKHLPLEPEDLSSDTQLLSNAGVPVHTCIQALCEGRVGGGGRV